jgi:1-aminocyclopropane-1-carboxylate deaminase/D-cysteine desulfhydrase-like pyridoxal-dependent ACC family enzyme
MTQDHYQTPIHRLNYTDGRNTYYIKRDDLLPFSFGGNKVRIAQAYFDDLEKKGCDCIVAYGNSRSNLCRVIANMSAAKGIPCYIVSPADDSGERIDTNNSCMVRAMGATIIPCLKTNVAATVERTLATASVKVIVLITPTGISMEKETKKHPFRHMWMLMRKLRVMNAKQESPLTTSFMRQARE